MNVCHETYIKNDGLKNIGNESGYSIISKYKLA